ncbi:MAG: hypothetical protein LBJ90_04260 [Treponema sp.]|nr:hypothetical protein [Treponema sp.]
MNEILVPEVIITIFIIFALLRPFFKRLWALEGLAWLPLAALCITIGIFPAYGFRPECIPLLIYEIIYNLFNIPLLVSGAASRSSGDFREKRSFFIIPAFALFCAAVLVMFVFSPRIPVGLTSAGIRTERIRDETRNRDYILRIYMPAGTNRAPAAGAPNEAGQPLIFLAPPEAGSLAAVDRICAGLRDRGFTVISYFQRGILPPAPEEGQGLPFPVQKSAVLSGVSGRASPAAVYRRWRAFRKGTVLKKANEQGQALEAEQREDLEFVVAQVRRISAAAAPGSGGLLAPPERPLVLAGFGAAGSVLAGLAEAPDFASRFGNIPGLIAIESRFWSAYRSDPPVFPPAPDGASLFRRFRTEAANWFARFRVQRTSGFGRLPRPSIPVLYLVSDLAPAADIDRPGSNPYGAVLEILRNSSSPAALAALEGAGPLDYYDYPLSRPLYSFLFQGLNKEAKSANPPEDTASLIGNFAAMLLEADSGGVSRLAVPAKRSLGAGVRIETRSWNLPDLRYILSP